MNTILADYEIDSKVIGVLVIIFILHLSYIPNGFTWIDHQDIERGWAVYPLTELYKSFISPLGLSHFYRPLINILYSIDSALYGQWIAGYHLTNVIIQLGVVLVTILLARKVFHFDENMSLLAGLIAGVHPLNWLPVGAIAYRQEILVTIFSWLALIFYVQGRNSEQRKFLLLSLGSFLLALLSKETALFWVPAIIAVWEILLSKNENIENNNNDDLSDIKKYRKKMLFGGILIAVIYAIMRTYAISGLWSIRSVSMTLSEHMGTRLKVLGYRLLELINPFKPSLSDATVITQITNPSVIITSLILIFLFSIIVLYWKKYPRVVTLMAMIIVGLLPALNIIPLPRFSSPHYSYFSMPVAVMLMVLTYQYIKNTLKLEFIANALMGILLAIMAFTTFQSGFQFKDDLTLFLPEIANDQNFREAQFYVGTYYFRNNNLPLASFYLEESLKEKPNVIAYVDKSAAQINLAGVRLNQGRLDDAEILLKQVEAPETALQIPYNLALIARERKDYDEVISLLENIDPSVHVQESVLLLTQSYIMTNQNQKADQILSGYFPEFTIDQKEIIKKQLQTEANNN